MKILVWGLGYVGTVTAACLADLGHDVVGVETNPIKVKAIKSGKSVIKEPGLDNLVAKMVGAGRLQATQDGGSIVSWADVSLICVGTPSAADGSPSLDHVHQVAAEIGLGLRSAPSYHVVVMRSTVFPGTIRSFLRPVLEEKSGKQAGADFGLASNPEFLRETIAVSDFRCPPYTVIGQLDSRSGNLVEKMYRDISAPVHRVQVEEAEFIKLVNNGLHGLKIAFANEVGRICDQLEIDSHVIMNLVCQDTKLNISPTYLTPGFAFGGSCLPKDLRALVFHSRRLGLQLPVLESILPSNRLQIEAARVKVNDLRARRVAVLGIAFKPGTDDLRESPVIELIRNLWQDGVDVVVYDPDIRLEEMLGSNREYLERQLPQIRTILKTELNGVLDQCDAVVLTQRRREFGDAVSKLDDRVAVIDLVRVSSDRTPSSMHNYRGMSW